MKQTTEVVSRAEEEARTAGRLKLREILAKAVRMRAAPRHVPSLSNPLLLEWLKGTKIMALDYEYLRDVPSEVLAELNEKLTVYFGITEGQMPSEVKP